MHDTRGNGAALSYAFLVLTLYLFVSTLPLCNARLTSLQQVLPSHSK